MKLNEERHTKWAPIAICCTEILVERPIFFLGRRGVSSELLSRKNCKLVITCGRLSSLSNTNLTQPECGCKFTAVKMCSGEH